MPASPDQGTVRVPTILRAVIPASSTSTPTRSTQAAASNGSSRTSRAQGLAAASGMTQSRRRTTGSSAARVIRKRAGTATRTHGPRRRSSSVFPTGLPSPLVTTVEDRPTGSQTADLKPRSREVTDGIAKAPARAMLRAVGMGDEDWDKPQIGVASSWNEITPCNLSLDRLAKRAKEGVHAAGGYPLEFGTISVSDGISMGHEGMRASLVSREIIADSVETVMFAERLDGSVLRAGCDKSLPGMLMAAARLDLASVFLYSGSTLPGRLGDRDDITIIDVFEAVGACARGLISRDELADVEKAACPGMGACGGMYTANTMASVAEALGMSLPGSAAPPAPDNRRDAFAVASGEAGGKLLPKGIPPRQNMTRRGVEKPDTPRVGPRGAAPPGPP